MKKHQIHTIVGITLLCLLALTVNRQANAATDQLSLNGTYQGTIALNQPVQLGILDFALAVTQEGNQLQGQIDGTYTLFSENTPPLQGNIENSTAMTPTFTLTSDSFSDQIAGKAVERTVTLKGDVLEDGATLQGVYTEQISGFTPVPMTTQGQFIVTRPSTAAPMTVVLQVGKNSLESGQNTSVTATVRDQDGQPLPGVLVVFQGVLGTVAPTNGVTDSNGQVTVTFTAGTFAERGAVTALAESAVASAAIEIGGDDSSENTACLDSIFVSSSSGGKVSGIKFRDEDILLYNECTNKWAMFVDGSDIGLAKTDINAFVVLNNGDILMSIDKPLTIAGLGKVDDSDIIKFMPTKTGAKTAGTLAWYFDGSDVGLTKSSEDIDALTLLSGNRLLISTLGNAAVQGVNKVRDEDMLLFTMTQSGKSTKGTWARYFDGSDVKLTKSAEDIVGVSMDESENRLDLTTLGSFSVAGSKGAKADIFSCTPSSTGSNTKCAFNSKLTWDGSKFGFAKELVDGITVLAPSARAASSMAHMSDLEYVELGPLATVAIDAPQIEFVGPNRTTTISYTIANLSDEAATYSLELSQEAGWMLTDIPESITVSALDEVEVLLNVTPSTVTEETITLNVTDLAASQNTSVDVSEIGVIDLDQFMYLPLVKK